MSRSEVRVPHQGHCAQGRHCGEALLQQVHLDAKRLLRTLALVQGCTQAPDLLIPGCAGALQGLRLRTSRQYPSLTVGAASCNLACLQLFRRLLMI